MEKTSKIYVAGHNGMVGSAIIRLLKSQGYTNLITRSSQELDLCNQSAVIDFFQLEKPEYVFLAAAKVGGINANQSQPAEFFFNNLSIQTNVLHQAYLHKVKKLLFLGSSCIYPKFAKQPIAEKELLTGELEPTNEAYALAKISGLKMCEAYREQYGCNFIAAMPTNLYGINDNFDLESSHVLPALIRKFHEAKVNQQAYVTLWGTGSALREFLYVDDLAQALLFLMLNYSEKSHINVGTGDDLSISSLAQKISNLVGYTGQIKYDDSMPDGTPKKQLNTNKINSLGWKASTSLEEGIHNAYQWFLNKDFKST
jgi:GDP-L-fucose synthase